MHRRQRSLGGMGEEEFTVICPFNGGAAQTVPTSKADHLDRGQLHYSQERIHPVLLKTQSKIQDIVSASLSSVGKQD